VMYVHPEPQGEAGSICWSDSDGAYQAVRHLLDLGHTRIAGLFAEYPDTDPPLAKVAGFRKAIREAGAVGLEWRGVLSADAFENACLLTARYLREHPEVTAVFARNDTLALGVMRAAREAGRSIPCDLSVIGYNDTLLAHCADPGLTSVRTPIARAGEIAVEQVVRALAERDADFPEVVLPTTLTVRESCAPPEA
jgi:DNA-binding LacI/PurR family transcriptional regulator